MFVPVCLLPCALAHVLANRPASTCAQTLSWYMCVQSVPVCSIFCSSLCLNTFFTQQAGPYMYVCSDLVTVHVCTVVYLHASLNCYHYSFQQKDASSALAHSGAHLDLSAFSSPEVKCLFIYLFIYLLNDM